jgi:hypothetical protein
MGLLNRETRRQLLEVLAGMGVLDTSAGRTLLLQDLPPIMINMTPRAESKLLDLNAMLDNCEHWEPAEGTPHPLRLLIENARDLVAGSGTATRLQAILNALPASASEATPTAEPTPAPPPPPSTPAPAAEATAAREDHRTALRAAFAPFLADLDEIGNPDLLSKARELRSALQQDEPDVEHITELRRWFAGRPGRARDTAAAFFATPIVRQIIADANRQEYES